ncbi:MAG: AAA family ATPase, partial [Verrucomicrobia bacterium]|nr:AAA family ATPase [Verrucomicrobiota bacterium]
RFGKSVFLSTLKEILKRNKALFTGLFIESSDYTWPLYGVIHLDLGPIDSLNIETTKKSLCQILARVAKEYRLQIDLDSSNPNQALIELVDALYAIYKKVAILIDEYDHPILQVLQEPKAEEIRKVLQSFFTTVKSLNEQVHFLFITGVSMFSKADIFSGMNNPVNISLDPKYAGICGYTDEEMDFSFKDYINRWAEKENVSPKLIREALRTWYNGYRFSEDPLSVYNPFSISSALNQQKFRNFWFETGSPSFLMKELQKKYRHEESSLFQLEHFKVSSGLLGTIEVDSIPLSTLLFQTGYLTLAKYDTTTQNYWLEFPNHEVKTALHQHLLTLVANADPESADYASKELKTLLNLGDLEKAISSLRILFSHVPYQLHIEKEYFYHGLLQMAFSSAGIKCQSEYSTSHARIDLILELQNKIYIIEVKFNESAEVALSQIEARRYYEPFLNSGKAITLLGLSFIKKPNDFQIYYTKKEI